MTTRFHRWLVRSVVALAVIAALPVAHALAAATALTPAQSDALLKAIVGAGSNERTLTAFPGIGAPAAARIAAHRKAGKTFGSIDELRSVSQISDADFEKLSARFGKLNPAAGDDEKREAARLSAERGTTPVAMRTVKTGAAEKAPAPGPPPDAGGGKLDLDVQGGYYSVLPGYDLSKVDETKRKAFLDTVNREMCNCGCSGETLGYCLVNDPGCPVVKARVKKIYADVVGGAPTAPAH